MGSASPSHCLTHDTIPSFSCSSDSSSSVEIIDADAFCSRSAEPVSRRSERSDATVGVGGGSTDAVLSRSVAERLASSLRTQHAVDALCEKYSVPREFTARPAGDLLRACSPPPPRAVCVYAHALEAGMRVPLHDFVCEVLGHFGLAPSQIAPNGWRIMIGFIVLSHHAGVPPSLAVFRHFFSLCFFKLKGWYCFRGKDTAGVLFTSLPKSNKGWKESFFFLASPAPWPCPVRWGEPPSKNSTAEPVLTGEEKKLVAKLLNAHGAAVDLGTYLCESNLTAAFSSKLAAASPETPPSPSTRAKGMDPSIFEMMKSMRAEKAAASAQALVKEEVKTEPGWSPWSGKKRKFEADANAKDGLSRSELNNTPLPAPRGGCSVSALRAPPGFSPQRPPESNQDRKPGHVPDMHDSDSADWEAARQLLQGIITPSRERTLPAARPSDVIASSYLTLLQAANYATFSFGYALELEEKLRAREGDAAAEAGLLREELEKTKTELAAARKSAAEAKRSTPAAAVLQEYLRSDEHKRQLAAHALEGYERGLEDLRTAALRRYPHLDAAELVVPPGRSH
ncbi:hypothetical protein ABZP36_010857 [Zizania latifolia]